MDNLFKGVYKNKTVLITGHTGFKGSWLTLWLKLLGANVIGYSTPDQDENLFFNNLDLKTEITNIYGDVRNYEHVKEVLTTYKPEFVFHLAAQSLVRKSYKMPRMTFETNALGTMNLLDAIKETGDVKVVVNVTSDKCYKNNGSMYSYREIDELGGYDPYSSSKAIAEMITTVYKDCYFDNDSIGIATVRAGNVFGGGDWAEDRLIPDCVRALSKNIPIELRNPTSIRPWQYVLDAIYGYIHLGSLLYLNPKKYSESWNFGPNDDAMISVERVTELFVEHWGYGEIKINDDSNLKEENILRLDNSKAKHMLQWKPIYNIEEVIEATAQWYKSNFNKNDMKSVSIGQLQIFAESMVSKNNKLFEKEIIKN